MSRYPTTTTLLSTALLLLVVACPASATTSDQVACALNDANRYTSDLSKFAAVEEGPCVNLTAAMENPAMIPIPAGYNASQCNGTVTASSVQIALCAAQCQDTASGSGMSLPFFVCQNGTQFKTTNPSICSCGFSEKAYVSSTYCSSNSPSTFLTSTQLTPACLYQSASVCKDENNKACLWDGDTDCCQVYRSIPPWLPPGLSQVLMWIIIVVFILLMIQSIVMCFMNRRRIRGYISGIRTRAQAKDILDAYMLSLDDYHPTPQPGTQPVAIGNVNVATGEGDVLSGTALLGGTPGDECAICLSDMASKRAVQLLCQHCFHRECIEDLLQHELVMKNEVLCPLCRSVFMQAPADRQVTGTGQAAIA